MKNSTSFQGRFTYPELKQNVKILLLTFFLSLTILGAEYKGKSIDGKKYAASVDTGTVILSCDVSFDGTAVYVYADDYFTGKLLSEEIVDPLDVEFTVGTESWTLEILDELP